MKLIYLAIKHYKKIISVLLICLLLTSNISNVYGQIYSKDVDDKIKIETNIITEYKITDSMKQDLLRKSKVTTQSDFASKLKHGDKFILVDYHTNKYMVYKKTMGNDFCHADIEPIDKEVTKIVKSMYNDRDYWRTRPVLAVLENGEVYCCSCYIVEHAGRDDAESLKYTTNRSRGYGDGQNLDTIKNNMDGHNCLHVRKSLNHFNRKINKAHQANIDFLESEKEKLN